MNTESDYLAINRQLWNARTGAHLESDFYDLEHFLKGKTSLKEVECSMLGDIRGKSLLHLQCHFGQDTISLARLGATVTGADLSDAAISAARKLADDTHTAAQFICSDLYTLPEVLHEQFDIVFTTYGTIGWLPEIDRWAQVVAHFLKPGGSFVFVEFHPFVWMMDEALEQVKYRYFHADAIIESESGTYADKAADIQLQSVGWNHSIGEVTNSLLRHGLQINLLDEYDFSPYNVFPGMTEDEPGKFRVAKYANKIPLLYSIKATKTTV